MPADPIDKFDAALEAAIAWAQQDNLCRHWTRARLDPELRRWYDRERDSHLGHIKHAAKMTEAAIGLSLAEAVAAASAVLCWESTLSDGATDQEDKEYLEGLIAAARQAWLSVQQSLAGKKHDLTPEEDWEFEPGRFRYKKEWHALAGQKAELLSAFVSARHMTLTQHKIVEVCGRGYETNRPHAYVSELNAALCELLKLKDKPIKPIRGQKAYRLALPF